MSSQVRIVSPPLCPKPRLLLAVWVGAIVLSPRWLHVHFRCSVFPPFVGETDLSCGWCGGGSIDRSTWIVHLLDVHYIHRSEWTLACRRCHVLSSSVVVSAPFSFVEGPTVLVVRRCSLLCGIGVALLDSPDMGA